MDFLDKKPKLTQEDIYDLSDTIAIKEIEFIVKIIFTKTAPGPDDFNNEFYQNI